MKLADQAAIQAGTSGYQLMQAAGKAVAAAVARRWSVRPVSILCGPGNNGGDGFVVARHLHAQGWPVRVGLLGTVSGLPEDARAHAEAWQGPVEPLSLDLLNGAGLVVDALFGAGLSRPLDGVALQLVERLEHGLVPICAVDIPSGIDGETGQARGLAVTADLTVTFFCRKPGHLLLPGRIHCGQTLVANIGISHSVLARLNVRTWQNDPDLWRHAFPWPQIDSHKYKRGHVLIRGGRELTGAGRLAAMAAARIGAGLVTVAAPHAAWPVYAGSLLSAMVVPCDTQQDWGGLLADQRCNVIVAGPGLGVSDAARAEVLAALHTERAVILDAGALTNFADDPDTLFDAIQGPCVLTPHEGEFRRLFNVTGSKPERARAAALKSGAVVVLKGPDTVIAAPDGRVVINDNAPPELATAGTGDVLAGMIAGLTAQGMGVFKAAATAVWMHGRVATLKGAGLLAEDLPDGLPAILRELRS